MAKETKLKEYLCSSPLCQYEGCMNLKLSPLHPRIAGMSTTVLVCMKKGGEMREGKTVTINGKASQNGQNWFKCNMTRHSCISVTKVLYRLSDYTPDSTADLSISLSDWLQATPTGIQNTNFPIRQIFFVFFLFCFLLPNVPRCTFGLCLLELNRIIAWF
jgi:hypothetical protein